MSKYGEPKSKGEWHDYVEMRLGRLRSASFVGLGQQEQIKMLRTLCHAKVHGRMNVQQEHSFRGILRQALPRLREISAAGVSVPHIVLETVEREIGKKIESGSRED